MPNLTIARDPVVHVDHTGRWEAPGAGVAMASITDGPAPGQWDGSVAHVEFRAPSVGAYAVLVEFEANGARGELYGPWGMSHWTTPSGSDPVPATVTAAWTATAPGDRFRGTLLFRGGSLARLTAIEVRAAFHSPTRSCPGRDSNPYDLSVSEV